MKTKQQERFEASWKAAYPTANEGYWLRVDDNGAYAESPTLTEFEGFKLGEASALERAAKVCDTKSSALRDMSDISGAWISDGLADEIRALAQEVGNDN